MAFCNACDRYFATHQSLRQHQNSDRHAKVRRRSGHANRRFEGFSFSGFLPPANPPPTNPRPADPPPTVPTPCPQTTSSPVMDQLPYAEILSSGLFEFLVGPQRTQFQIHATLVAHQSPALNKLVNGDMKEAKEQSVFLEETDVETFIRFGEYVYTGNYQGASPQEEMEHDKRESREADYHRWGEKKRSLWDRFKCLYPDTSLSRNEPGSYAEVFLSHARLYVLADYYGIDALKLLCLRKLHGILVAFTLYEERIGDIIQLVQYCYENTVDWEEKVDELRLLINLYTACKVEDLCQSQEFKSLLETNGQYSGGLVKEILRRLD